MGYLDPSEYVVYGLTAETTDDLIAMASALMEAYCRRPSLLVTQYVERMRLTANSQAVRLSYLPLNPLGAAKCRTRCWRRWLGRSASPAVGARWT
jgi:hypothetical protein